MNRSVLRCTWVLTLLIIMAPVAFGDGRAFTVRFLAGPQGFTQPKIKLKIEGHTLTLTGKARNKRQSFTVPLQTVTFMSHSPVRFNRAGQVSRTVPNADLPRMGSCSGLGCAGNVLALFAWGAYEVGRGAAVGVAATQHGKQHFIVLDWRDEGVEYELQFEAGKDDYSQLIKDFESATGRRFFDFEERWKQAAVEIQKEASRAETVTLKRVVRLGELSLVPNTYKIVIIQGQGSYSELYFFEGQRIDSTTFKGVAPVTVADAKSPGTMKESEVDYTDTAPTQIREIRTSTRIVTFTTSQSR